MPLSTWAATLSSTCANRSFPMTKTPGSLMRAGGFLCLSCRWGRIVLLQFLRRKPAPLVGTLRWGDFLPPESHQRPPKAGPSPALWNPPRRYGVEGAPFSIRPWTGSGHIDGGGFYRTCVLLCVFVLLSPVPYPWCAAVSSYRKHAPHPRVLPSPMAPLYKGSCLP